VSEETTNPYRFELKVPLEGREYELFYHWLRQAGLATSPVYPDRRVNSVYLDSADLGDYQDNVAGISRRGKLRLRWYDQRLQDMVLEFKNKRGRLANKLVVPLENSGQLEPVDRHGVARLLRSHDRGAALLRQGLLFPSLRVSYSRSYFELSPGIRMTVDRDIRYQRLYPMRGAALSRSPVPWVIEIKHPPELRERASRLLEGIPGRVFRHSKYVIGVDSVCDL
jgi:hypothetical protein